jgi:hypothetical protein
MRPELVEESIMAAFIEEVKVVACQEAERGKFLSDGTPTLYQLRRLSDGVVLAHRSSAPL